MPTSTRSLREPEERVGQCSNAALPPPIISEETLVQRLRRLDEDAVRMLYDRYRRALHHVALQFVHRTEEAEEVVQQTWMAVLKGIHRFEGRSTFRTWLFRILINRARSRAKRDARVIPFSDLSRSQKLFVDTAAARTEPVLDAELHAVLEAAVDLLPHKQRAVIRMRDFEGWSAEEVCDALKMTAGSQRVALHRARVAVRQMVTTGPAIRS